MRIRYRWAKKRYQRRHSALRTISGGICWGLTLRRTGSMQLRLLGYQQIVNNAGFKGNLFFFNPADIVLHFLRQKDGFNHTLLLSANSGMDFRPSRENRSRLPLNHQ